MYGSADKTRFSMSFPRNCSGTHSGNYMYCVIIQLPLLDVADRSQDTYFLRRVAPPVTPPRPHGTSRTRLSRFARTDTLLNIDESVMYRYIFANTRYRERTAISPFPASRCRFSPRRSVKMVVGDFFSHISSLFAKKYMIGLPSCAVGRAKEIRSCVKGPIGLFVLGCIVLLRNPSIAPRRPLPLDPGTPMYFARFIKDTCLGQGHFPPLSTFVSFILSGGSSSQICFWALPRNARKTAVFFNTNRM